MSYRHSTMVDSLPSNTNSSTKGEEAWKTNKVRPKKTEEGWKMSSRLRPAQLDEDYKRQSMPVAPLSEHSNMIAGWTPRPLTQEPTIQPFNIVLPQEHPTMHHHHLHQQQQQQQHEPFNPAYPYEQPYQQQQQQQQQEPYNYIHSQETFQEPYNIMFHPPEQHYTAPYHSSPALNNTNYTPYTDEYSPEYISTNDYLSHEYIPPHPQQQQQQQQPFQEQSYHEQPYYEQPQQPQQQPQKQPQQPQKQQKGSTKDDEKKKNTDMKSEDRVGRITVQSVNSEYIVWINILPNDTGLLLAERIRNIATMRTKKIVSITSLSGRKIPLDNRPIFGNWMDVSSFKDGERWQVEWRDNDRGVVDRFISKLF